MHAESVFGLNKSDVPWEVAAFEVARYQDTNRSRQLLEFVSIVVLDFQTGQLGEA